MIVPDINLLIYTYDASSPFHSKAVSWWQSCLSGTEPIGLLHVVLFGFVRLVPHPRAFRNPMTVVEAAGHVRSWLEQPPVQVVAPEVDHVGDTLKLLETLGTAGNLVTDAQIAALVMNNGAVLHTADADFVRFPKLRWFNPITGTGSSRMPSARRSP